MLGSASGFWSVQGVLILACLVCASEPATARMLEIYPSTATGDEEFERVANTLQPGDTLVLHGGSYSQSERRAIKCNGTATAPIEIRAAKGESPLLTRPAETMDTENNIEIVECSYLTLRGLRFGGGSIGVRVTGGHHITIEDCEIFGTGNVGLSMNSGSCDAMTIRHNEIHHTGQSTSGTTEGEGMYVGCNEDKCRVTNSLIENNHIHDLRATSDGGNDGIEVKVGSYGNVIRNNVIHDTNIGRRYPGIIVYGGGSPANIVEGNAIWNCGEAIQVISDAIIRNNLILNSDVGISAGPHVQVPELRNVTIANNTIFGDTEGIHVRWAGAKNMILANNAIYCPDGTAVNVSGLGAAIVLANYVQGDLAGARLDNSGFFLGGPADLAFVNPGAMDFWPSSTAPFRGRAVPSYAPAADFNGTARTAPYDVGAYELEHSSSNPGWALRSSFKSIGTTMSLAKPAPPVDTRTR